MSDIFRCHHSDECANHPAACRECWRMADAFENYPYFVKKTHNGVTFKIFFGTQASNPADAQLNRWLSCNPSVQIVGYQFQQTQVGHSICIMYKEKE